MNTGSLPITPTQQIVVIAIKHKHILKESTFTLPLYHELPAQNNSTPRHMGRGLAGHPRSVKLGSGDNKTRLRSPICLKTPAIWQHGLHLGSGQHVLSAEVMDLLAKGAIKTVPPAQSQDSTAVPRRMVFQEGWNFLVPRRMVA